MTTAQILIAISFCFIASTSQAQDIGVLSSRGRVEFGLDYMQPKDPSREIKTINATAFFWKKYFQKVFLNISAGFTITYAWGNIIVPTDNLIYERHNTAAVGFGPVVKLQLTVFRAGPFAIDGEVSEGPILYSAHFPYGGDIYNFMFRAGPDLSYKIDNRYALVAGLRFMHVSNAQGIEPHNPSYEAIGLNLSFVKFL